MAIKQGLSKAKIAKDINFEYSKVWQSLSKTIVNGNTKDID